MSEYNECDSHFEHRFISKFGKALVRSQPTALIQYKTPSTDQHWEPNLFVDIAEEYEFKIKSLEEFKSQAHRYCASMGARHGHQSTR